MLEEFTCVLNKLLLRGGGAYLPCAVELSERVLVLHLTGFSTEEKAQDGDDDRAVTDAYTLPKTVPIMRQWGGGNNSRPRKKRGERHVGTAIIGL